MLVCGWMDEWWYGLPLRALVLSLVSSHVSLSLLFFIGHGYPSLLLLFFLGHASSACHFLFFWGNQNLTSYLILGVF